METHVKKLVDEKRAATRKAALQGIGAGTLVIIGVAMRHAWGVPGELVAVVGFLMCGWFARGMSDAGKIDTRFNESIVQEARAEKMQFPSSPPQLFIKKVKQLMEKYEVQLSILLVILIFIGMGVVLGWMVVMIWIALIVAALLRPNF